MLPQAQRSCEACNRMGVSDFTWTWLISSHGVLQYSCSDAVREVLHSRRVENIGCDGGNSHVLKQSCQTVSLYVSLTCTFWLTQHYSLLPCTYMRILQSKLQLQLEVSDPIRYCQCSLFSGILQDDAASSERWVNDNVHNINVHMLLVNSYISVPLSASQATVDNSEHVQRTVGAG